MNFTILGLGIYLLATLIVTWLFGRSKKSEDYLLGGRNLGLWTSSMSIMSSKISAGLLLTYMAYVYLWGFAAAAVFLGVVVGIIIFIPFASYLKREADEHKLYTLPEFYRKKFGVKVGLLFALLMFLIMLLDVGGQLIGGARIIAEAGGLSYNWALLVIAVIVVSYLLVGGFKSVVATDLLQGFCLFALLPILLWISYVAIGDFSSIDWSSTQEGIDNIFNFVLLGVVLPFATPELWQRVYAVKNQKILTKTLLTTAVLYSLFGFILTVLGLYFRGVVGEIIPETLLMKGFKEVLPVGVMSLGLVFLMAAVMSSFDTYIYTAASIFVQDFISPKGKEHSDERAVFKLRLTQLVLVAIAVLIAYFYPSMVHLGILVISVYVSAGFIGVAVSLRREKLTPPVLALLLGILGTIYAVITEGVEPSLVSYAALGALIGLIIPAIYKTVRKSKVIT